MKNQKKLNSAPSLINIAKDLFPIYRCLIGPGVVETLKYIKKIHKKLKIKNIKSGSKVFDWKVPQEWHVKTAYIANLKGKKLIDLNKNNLHLVGYSTPQNKTISLRELEKHLHSLPLQPNAIPYVTSYYKKNWGFCLTYKQKTKLKDKKYKIFIDSSFKKGFLKYGEIYIKGSSNKEILFSTYICHPSMANNEISGPSIAIKLAEYLKKKKLRYSYRIIFIPETIGSIAYISKNFIKMKKNIIAGFNLTCLGDKGNFSLIPTRDGNTLSDKIVKEVFQRKKYKYKKYSWLDRGSDERQFCSPGVDLPIVTITRSKFGTYKEYHTSLDDMNFIRQKYLKKSYNLFVNIIISLERKKFFKSTVMCEPQLSKRNLYPSLSIKHKKNKYSNKEWDKLLDIISYCDGKNDVNEISKKCSIKINQCINLIDKLRKNKLIRLI